MKRDMQVAIRDLHAGDTAVDELFAGLSESSRYLRFHRPMPFLSTVDRAQLLAVDRRNRIVLVAETGPPGPALTAGIAWLSRTGDRRGEVAVAVVDRFQGRGVGTALLRELRARAVSWGYEELHADVLPGNHAALALADRIAPLVRIRHQRDVVAVSASIGTAAWSLTADDLIHWRPPGRRAPHRRSAGAGDRR